MTPLLSNLFLGAVLPAGVCPHPACSLPHRPVPFSPCQEAPALSSVQELQQSHERTGQSVRARPHGCQDGQIQHPVATGGAPEAAEGRGRCHRSQAGQNPRESIVGRAPLVTVHVFINSGKAATLGFCSSVLFWPRFFLRKKKKNKKTPKKKKKRKPDPRSLSAETVRPGSPVGPGTRTGASTPLFHVNYAQRTPALLDALTPSSLSLSLSSPSPLC